MKMIFKEVTEREQTRTFNPDGKAAIFRIFLTSQSSDNSGEPANIQQKKAMQCSDIHRNLTLTGEVKMLFPRWGWGRGKREYEKNFFA